MSNDIEITNSQINIHLHAMINQLKMTNISDRYNSLSDALEQLNLWDFLFIQAKVVACLHAFERRDTKIINNIIHRRK